MMRIKLFRCDSCEALMINGVFCHETGCRRSRSRWDEESGEWIDQIKCRECGCMFDKGSDCCSEF